MKKWIGLLIAVAGLNAHASWMQDYCSDAEGATQMRLGHNESFLFITKQTWKDREMQSERIDLKLLDEVNYEVRESQLLHDEYRSSCDVPNPPDVGYGSGKSVSYKKVSISYKDGRLFDEGVVGVNQDRTAVEVYMICKQLSSGQIPCR